MEKRLAFLRHLWEAHRGKVRTKELSCCFEACATSREEVERLVKDNYLMRLAVPGDEPILVLTSIGAAYAGVKSPGEWK